MKKSAFLRLASILNTQLEIIPLLFGSLGLEQRLQMDLQPDDIDILIPEIYLAEKWPCIMHIMADSGYTLYDLHEHAFEKDGISVAFAPIESLAPFAGIGLAKIPIVTEMNCRYYLLDLPDYLKVYTASSRDGYRQQKKNKNDRQKIHLIQQALNTEKSGG